MSDTNIWKRQRHSRWFTMTKQNMRRGSTSIAGTIPSARTVRCYMGCTSAPDAAWNRERHIKRNINFYFDCKTRLCLIVPGRQEKIYFAQESFYLQGILDDINEQDTSFLDCKHKHMMKSGAPHDKFLYCMVTHRISWFHKQN